MNFDIRSLSHSNSLILSCPICDQPLVKEQNSVLCTNNHRYDFAKEGYVHLLPSHHKKAKNPGDNKLMVQCRKQFLENRYYDFLISEIKDTIRNCKKISDETIFLDIGCGEGYFTDKLQQDMLEMIFYAMDISKDAIKVAGKKNREIHWFVASSNDLPVLDKRVDIVLKINAPLNFETLKRKLKPDAVVINISPGKEHLNTLRDMIYDNPQPHKSITSPDGYECVAHTCATKRISINTTQDIQNLFTMTPYYWNASHETKTNISKLNQLDTTASFNIHVYQLKNKVIL